MTSRALERPTSTTMPMGAPPARCANVLQARLACVTAACVQDRRVRDGFCLSGLCLYVPAWPRVRASWLASRDGFSCVPAGRRQCRFQPCYRALPLASAYAVHLCRACSSSNLFSRCAITAELGQADSRASSHALRQQVRASCAEGPHRRRVHAASRVTRRRQAARSGCPGGTVLLSLFLL